MFGFHFFLMMSISQSIVVLYCPPLSLLASVAARRGRKSQRLVARTGGQVQLVMACKAVLNSYILLGRPAHDRGSEAPRSRASRPFPRLSSRCHLYKKIAGITAGELAYSLRSEHDPPRSLRKLVHTTKYKASELCFASCLASRQHYS